VLGRDLTLYPKLIHPLPPQAALSDSPVLDAGGEMGPDSWLQSLNRERPPTPPRGRLTGRAVLEF
jgi:hypothetical protein